MHHRGRRSGLAYTTPVNAFPLDDSVIVSLTYGPSADWVQNVLAGGAELEDRSGTRRIVGTLIVGRAIATPALPGPVRLAVRLLRVEHFAQLSFD